MRAIIIAAGMGMRLHPATKQLPKSLLEVGSGITLLDTQLRNLAACGISDISIIVGFEAAQIVSAIARYKGKMDVKTIHNPLYGSANNLVSVWHARHLMNDDFITINGDDYFERSVIRTLLQSEHDITMVIDEKAAYDDDDMKVVHRDGTIRKISKTISAKEANGESIGIIKFSKAGGGIYRAALEKMSSDPLYRDAFYLRAIQEIIDTNHPVHYVLCRQKDWHELDVPSDLESMRDLLA